MPTRTPGPEQPSRSSHKTQSPARKAKVCDSSKSNAAAADRASRRRANRSAAAAEQAGSAAVERAESPLPADGAGKCMTVDEVDQPVVTPRDAQKTPPQGSSAALARLVTPDTAPCHNTGKSWSEPCRNERCLLHRKVICRVWRTLRL